MKAALLGDASTHGGTITQAGPNTTVRSGGRLLCVQGAMLACPAHGLRAITATSTVRVGGLKVVRSGDVATCGASIVANSGGLNCG
jgi:uncharacterized Zn-binding protein involved in type VI secretion